MSRSGVMSVLDRLEGLTAEYVIDFNEDPIRSKGNGQNKGCDCVKWQKCLPVHKLSSSNLFNVEVVLEEDDINATLNHITISDVDQDSLLLQPDNFCIRYFQRGSYGKACDYLLFKRYKSERYAIFIELKSKIYEKPETNTYFKFEKQKDKAIVWQMIGADALLDNFIDILTKKECKNCISSSGHKKLAAKNELINFKRRYIVLYQNVDETGLAQLNTSILPNPNALESPVHALKVFNGERFCLSHLFLNGGLEE